MAVTLQMRPSDPPCTFDDFIALRPRFSVAIDGYVTGPTAFEEKGPWLNLNHHEGVDRIATRATCAQALHYIRLGLFDCFRDASGPRMYVYANDCDEDVCTTWTLLHHPHLVASAINPILNRLVGVVDLMDMSAGAYPYPADLPTLRDLEWAFEPYRRFRHSGGLDRRDADEFTGVVTDVEHRILKHLVGEGDELPLDTRYERIGGGPGWTMIRETGLHGRTSAFHDGIRAYVIARARGDGRWLYTVGKVATFIPFPVPFLLRALDTADALKGWGGGPAIGGSARATGSALDPATVERIINEALASRGVP